MKLVVIGLTLFTAIMAGTHKWAIDQNWERSEDAIKRIEALEATCNIDA